MNEIENENISIYRRALIVAVKQMNEEQKEEMLCNCKGEIFGALLGAVFVSKFPQNQNKLNTIT